MRILDNILRFENHLNGAKKLRGKNLSDYLVYNTLAMECFQSANALIDIAESITNIKKLGFPSTYMEVFEYLYKNEIIKEDELKKAKKIVFLRNLISHEYYKIRENELIEMVELLEGMENFINRVKKMIKNGEL